ncbi:MAG: quinolinate synthase NadA [Myxococcota bacterium]
MSTQAGDGIEFDRYLDPAVIESTAGVYEKIMHLVTEPEWLLQAPLIHEINQLKQQVGAVVLAHNYQPVEIFYGIADITGDSLGLAKAAAEADEEVIVMCGVEFMAETCKLLNPDKTVLIPSTEAGCTLATSITAEDVRGLRDQYPGVPVVSYVNTSAAVKAESDICCTSSNALQVVESLDSDRVIFLPDKYLAHFVRAQTDVEIIAWDGNCVAHEAFHASDLRALRLQHPGIAIIAHPECTEEVQESADWVGSTSGLIDYLTTHRPQKAALITECTMSDNVSAQLANVELIQPCSLCPYMKRISLENTAEALRQTQHEIVLEESVIDGARRSVERMLAVSNGASNPC